jgi:hypothetical protein
MTLRRMATDIRSGVSRVVAPPYLVAMAQMRVRATPNGELVVQEGRVGSVILLVIMLVLFISVGVITVGWFGYQLTNIVMCVVILTIPTAFLTMGIYKDLTRYTRVIVEPRAAVIRCERRLGREFTLCTTCSLDECIIHTLQVRHRTIRGFVNRCHGVCVTTRDDVVLVCTEGSEKKAIARAQRLSELTGMRSRQQVETVLETEETTI